MVECSGAGVVEEVAGCGDKAGARANTAVLA